MNTPIEFDTFKLLKETHPSLELDEKHCSIGEVIDLLYHHDGVWITVKKDWKNGVYLGFEAIIECNNEHIHCGTFKTPTEAYQEAIKHYLKIKTI